MSDKCGEFVDILRLFSTVTIGYFTVLSSTWLLVNTLENHEQNLSYQVNVSQSVWNFLAQML